MSKKKDLFTVMLIPHFGKKSIKFNISLTSFYLIIFLFLEIVFLNIILYFSYSKLEKEAKELKNLKNAYEAEKLRIRELDAQSYALKKKVEEINKLEEELKKTAGIKELKNERKFRIETNRGMTRELMEVREKYFQINREFNENIETLKKIKKIIEGKKIKLEYIPSCSPVEGKISSHFGKRWGRIHKGIDIDTYSGSLIRATASGIIVFSGSKKGYGNCVIINHLNGYSTFYAHNSKNLVKVNERVKKGEVIATVGETGNATGSHLHYEVRKNNIPVNPINYLNLGMKNLDSVLKKE